MDQDKSEHVREAMGVLSRYFDGLGLRSFARGVQFYLVSVCLHF
jgi:ornithine carbamoyltransferase